MCVCMYVCMYVCDSASNFSTSCDDSQGSFKFRLWILLLFISVHSHSSLKRR